MFKVKKYFKDEALSSWQMLQYIRLSTIEENHDHEMSWEQW